MGFRKFFRKFDPYDQIELDDEVKKSVLSQDQTGAVQAVSTISRVEKLFLNLSKLFPKRTQRSIMVIFFQWGLCVYRTSCEHYKKRITADNGRLRKKVVINETDFTRIHSKLFCFQPIYFQLIKINLDDRLAEKTRRSKKMPAVHETFQSISFLWADKLLKA